MSMHRFKVFGNIIVVEPTATGWEPFFAGAEGKRRRAGFEIPGFIAEDELCQFLADLFHESATAAHPDAYRIG
jgi:hypothetical protein